MYTDEVDGTSGEELTVESAAQSPAFAALLSDEEDQQESPKPPTQKSTESESEAEDVEASTEQAESATEESEKSEDPDATEEQPTEVLYPVRINGQEEMVTLEELRKGYSRQKDYTQKTQEISEQRRQLEAEIPAVREERVKLATYLTQLEKAIHENTPEEPDWAKLQQEKPGEWQEVWASWQVHKDRLKTIRDEREQAEAAVLRDQAQAAEAYINEQKSKLYAAIPEWKDPAVAKAEKAKLATYAQDLGYSKDELADVRDHRIMLVLRDAMRYRELQAKKPVITERIEKVKVATPGPAAGGSKPKSKADQAFSRLANTGKQEDLATALLLSGTLD